MPAPSPPDLLYGHLPAGILTETHILIPGLPTPMPRERVAWMEWAPTMLAHRERVASRCERDMQERRVQRMLCKQPHGIGTAYFLLTFGWIFEPRDDDDLAMMPFVLFPEQVLALFAIDGAMQRPKGQYSSVAMEKARGVGATWIDAGDHIHRWLFKKNYQGRLVSRNEDLVDKKGSSDSWMWKFDYILDRLPFWLLPKGYSSRSDYRKHLTILNPETGAAILGEATTSGVGVGGRATKYSIDEFARLRNGAEIWGQLSETTNHRVAISTHRVDDTTDFWDMVHGENEWIAPLVITMPWTAVPFRDEAWLEETRKTMRKDLFYREILMDPWKGLSTWVYPAAKVKRPVHAGYQQDAGLVLVGIDDGFDDDFAIIWSQLAADGRRLTVLDSYSGSKKAVRYYGHILTGEPVAGLDFDQDAYRVMDWVYRNRLNEALFAGDRHGANTDLTSGKSPFGVLEEEFGIHVMPNPTDMNTDVDRIDALADLLPEIDFADTPGSLKVLEAVRNNRRPAPRSDQVTTEQSKRIHNQTSHLTTALEYIACHVQFYMRGRRRRKQEEAAPVNNGMFSASRRLYGRRQAPTPERSWIV